MKLLCLSKVTQQKCLRENKLQFTTVPKYMQATEWIATNFRGTLWSKEDAAGSWSLVIEIDMFHNHFWRY